MMAILSTKDHNLALRNASLVSKGKIRVDEPSGHWKPTRCAYIYPSERPRCSLLAVPEVQFQVDLDSEQQPCDRV